MLARCSQDQHGYKICTNDRYMQAEHYQARPIIVVISALNLFFLSFFFPSFATKISHQIKQISTCYWDKFQKEQSAKPISNNLQLVSIGSKFPQRMDLVDYWKFLWINPGTTLIFRNQAYVVLIGFQITFPTNSRTLKSDLKCRSYADFHVPFSNFRSEREMTSGWK